MHLQHIVYTKTIGVRREDKCFFRCPGIGMMKHFGVIPRLELWGGKGGLFSRIREQLKSATGRLLISGGSRAYCELMRFGNHMYRYTFIGQPFLGTIVFRPDNSWSVVCYLHWQHRCLRSACVFHSKTAFLRSESSHCRHTNGPLRSGNITRYNEHYTTCREELRRSARTLFLARVMHSKFRSAIRNTCCHCCHFLARTSRCWCTVVNELIVMDSRSAALYYESYLYDWASSRQAERACNLTLRLTNHAYTRGHCIASRLTSIAYFVLKCRWDHSPSSHSCV